MTWLHTLVYSLLALPIALAHPHDMEEKTYQHNAQPLYRTTLAHCDSAFKEPEFLKRTIERRHGEVLRLKKERGLSHMYVSYMISHRAEV
jgi:hypothetical protein